MKKNIKKDVIYCLIPIIIFIILINLLTNGSYLYGSFYNWSSEHVVIPEIFRSLFYSTKDLLPDFIFNIGNGENIYNLSYYGFLSPITLISYFLPSVNMNTYITVSTIITTFISTVLIYIFLKKQKFNSEVSLLSSVIFITSACISFHSHHHVMFINYFPFLILGLFGVDKKLINNRGWLLTLSVFLMIMTSFYFSIAGIITLIIYGIYKYLRKIKKITIKTFIPMLVSLLTPIIIGIFTSSILTIPTIMALINSREVSVTLKELFTISSPNSYLYNPYGIGLTAIIIPSIITFFKKKKENIYLLINLILFAIIPVFNYALNGLNGIDSKSLIPLLPLYIFVIASFLKDVFDKKISYKILIPTTIFISIFILISKYQLEYFIIEMIIILTSILLYEMFNKKYLIIIPLIITAFTLCYSINNNDYYVLKNTYQKQNKINKELIDLITKNDKEFYRISYDENKNIYQNIKYYSSNEQTDNIFKLMLTNNKYLISQRTELHGYEKVYETEEGIRIYKNDSVLPLGFASSNIMSYEEYEKLRNSEANEALLNVIVADTKSNHNFVTDIKRTNIELKDIFKTNKSNKDDSITIKTDELQKIEYQIPKKYRNKIMFISFQVSNCSKEEQSIKINNVTKKVECTSNKEVLNYILAEKNLNKLYIALTKGTYNLKPIEISYIDPAHIENVTSKIDIFDLDERNTKGDIITGAIEVNKDGYFASSIPYSNGFIVRVDGNQVPYENINNGFLGFKITKGIHDIEIEYHSPYKKLGIAITLVGLIMYAIVTILEYKRKF